MKWRSDECPKCGRIITPAEKRDSFTEMGLFRKPAPCPGCATVLIRAEWPWKMFIFGAIVLLASVATSTTLSLLKLESSSLEYVFDFFQGLGVIVFIVGVLTLRFEPMERPPLDGKKNSKLETRE